MHTENRSEKNILSETIGGIMGGRLSTTVRIDDTWAHLYGSDVIDTYNTLTEDEKRRLLREIKQQGSYNGPVETIEKKNGYIRATGKWKKYNDRQGHQNEYEEKYLNVKVETGERMEREAAAQREREAAAQREREADARR